ncbi:ATP-dependent DNA ligase [Streptomyces werraensis]|uniref:ATP-dependent DNA ligase n=1 Tax=Streptomyces werraensis TaxID=68284 RepID=UPI00382AAFA2
MPRPPAELPPEPALPGGLAFEQKPDGYRALLFAGPGGHAHLQSRNGTDLTPAFPEIAAADRALRVPLVLDGELVATAEGRLDFDQLHQRALRRGADARLAARDHPAYLIVFDILDTADGPLLDEPYRARRALLEEPFAHGVPADPFVLCSATIDRATAEDWLNPAWGAAGIEGIVVKGLAQRYQPGRIKVRAHASAEAVVAAVTGRVTAPSTLLLGRYDARGRLRFIAQTAPLSATARREVGGPAGGRRPSLPGRRQPPLGAAPLFRRLGRPRGHRPPAGPAEHRRGVRRGHRGRCRPLPAPATRSQAERAVRAELEALESEEAAAALRRAQAERVEADRPGGRGGGAAPPEGSRGGRGGTGDRRCGAGAGAGSRGPVPDRGPGGRGRHGR